MYKTQKPQSNLTLVPRSTFLSKALSYLILVVISAFPLSSAAFNSSSNDPIRIQADQAELDELKGISTYIGDVVLTQSTAVLKADKVIVYSNQEGLIKMEAFGKPAHYIQQQEGDKPPTHAYGETIIYIRADETLTLITNAKLEQGQNTFKGDKIDYDTITRVVVAKGGEEKAQRVDIIFHPVKKETDTGKSK